MYGRGEDTGKKLCIAGSLFLNLGLLVYFKYLNFLIEFWNKSTGYIHTGGSLSTMEILLPVGISFYIFSGDRIYDRRLQGRCLCRKKFFEICSFCFFFSTACSRAYWKGQKFITGIFPENGHSGQSGHNRWYSIWKQSVSYGDVCYRGDDVFCHTDLLWFFGVFDDSSRRWYWDLNLQIISVPLTMQTV